MLDNERHVAIKRSSEKSFGVLFALVLSVIALWPLANAQPPHYWALALAVALIIVAFSCPRLLYFPNKWWFRLGIFLGGIVGPLFCFAAYVLTVLPIGIAMQLLKKDLLNQELDSSMSSYWIERKNPVGSMKNQF